MAKREETSAVEWAVLAFVGWKVLQWLAQDYAQHAQAMPDAPEPRPRASSVEPAPVEQQTTPASGGVTDVTYWRDPLSYDPGSGYGFN
ncbi:MAG: hypothetical protein QOF02_3184 [Blastocatellia bacterium]|jgi:hypothetical protein|nr:hypothetical protein [Blastocatellia bacterium]